MDRHRFDADPDPDPTFHFDVDPDSDWHQNNADPLADLAPSLKQIENWAKFFTFILSNASLQCFSFLISGTYVIILVFRTAS